MRILMLGASGGCGGWITKLAVARGHDLTAIVREGSPYQPPAGVSIIYGDPCDPGVLSKAVEGQEVVISALGLRRAGRSPWAKLLSPPDLMQRMMTHLIPLMTHHSVSRLIVISAAGVGDSLAKLTWPVRKLVSSGNIAVAYRDLDAMERLLEQSTLDWLAVRPVTLTNGEPKLNAKIVDRYGFTSTIRRADVAAWMVNAVETGFNVSSRQVMLGS